MRAKTFPRLLYARTASSISLGFSSAVHTAAKATVSRLIEQFGFDVVDAGPLKGGWCIQRDTPGYGPRRTAEEIRRDLAAAKRYADQ
jgi:predicted dinucleotide-binding enzyme